MLKSKKRKKVSARRFRQMFARLWNEEVRQNGDAILDAYPNDATWTAYMLAANQPPSFLKCLSAELELIMARGWYTLDAVYYDESSSLQDIPGRNYVFPACMDVIIEHENGEDVETEMWKLLMFRSPLKVLIYYDYDEANKTTEERKTWLTQKLKKLSDWCTAVDSMWPEAGNTEYLFLVGNRTTVQPAPVWRYAIAKRRRFFRKWRFSKLKALR